MLGFRVYIYAFVAGAFLVLGGAFWFMKVENAKLHRENDALRASVRSMKLERDLSREAEQVAEARARASADKAKEYDKLREGILRNGQDAELPTWLRAVVVGVRADTNGEVGGTEDTE